MVLTPEQQQSVAEWAEQTDGLLEVWLCGPYADDDSRVDLALTIGGIAVGDPLTLYFLERERWEALRTELLHCPTVLLWYDPNGASRVYAFCQEASVLLYSRRA